MDTVNNSASKCRLDEDSLRLVIDEAVTNAMEHGNHWEPQKRVHVKIESSRDNICISVADEGSGFDVAKRSAELEKREVLSLRERGVFLMTKLCDKVTWNRKGNEVVLSLRKIQ